MIHTGRSRRAKPAVGRAAGGGHGPAHGALRAEARGAVRLQPLPAIAGSRPIDVAERFRDLPGLALLESARPGRNGRWSYLSADPLSVVTEAEAADPFAHPRAELARLDAGGADAKAGSGSGHAPVDTPPFLGGLIGYLSYDLGRRLERLPAIARDDQPLPVMRLGLHDWVIAWDRRSGTAWLGGRAANGDIERLERRLADVRDRLDAPGPRGAEDQRPEAPAPTTFVSGLDRGAFEGRVGAVRDAIERGEIYQANLTRRLEAPFRGDPWPLYRRLRTGDPALFAAYLDIGRHETSGAARALLSASPEPFLAVDGEGRVEADPIKGTRPRGRTRDDDRRLAAELLASAKDRAENVMIVDVLRNDLGRVSEPGSVTVPRLLRLERTAAVQHLVTTVSGRLAPGRDAWDLLTAAFPGGSITGAPKIRAMEILECLEPVRRGPYTGALGWIGPDGAMATSIAIRTFVADGTRLTLHVGGGITWGSDPGDEWDETVVKARGPLGAIGATEFSP